MANGIIAAKVKNRDDRYLVHPYGSFWDEVTASGLVLIDPDGNLVRDEDRYQAIGILNIATWVFNSAPDANSARTTSHKPAEFGRTPRSICALPQAKRSCSDQLGAEGVSMV